MPEETDVPPHDEGYIGDEEGWSGLEKGKEERTERYRDRRTRPSRECIVRKLANQHDLELDDLKSSKRTQPETNIRQEARGRLSEESYGPAGFGENVVRTKSTVIMRTE